MSLTDGIDNEFWTSKYISSDKDAGIVCLVCEGISYRIISVMECNVCTFEEFAPFDGLSDGKYDFACRNSDRIVFIVLR